MTNQEIKNLVMTKITGQGNQVDTGSILPAILTGIIDKTSDLGSAFLSIERLRQYLYRITFDKLPEDNGQSNAISGGCSAYVQDGKLFRTLDFKYDNAASFIVRTREFEGMAFVTGLNEGELTEPLINQLPYRIVDGRNNAGIKISTHILFNDWQWDGVGEKTIPLTRLPFHVLTKVKSMATIEQDLAGILDNLALVPEMGEYLLQILVTDGTTTYAILPPTSADQAFVLQDITTYPKLTNFRWVESDSVVRADLQTRPTGVERYNAMPCPLADLAFTKAYQSTDRLSEFIGIDGTTKMSTDEELTAIYNVARAEYLTRKRDGKTWHTMHAVVYGDKMETLYIQENWNDEIVFDPDNYARKSEIGSLSELDTDHKANIVAAINELADILETTELVVSLTKTAEELKNVYDLVAAHPQLGRNVVVVGSDGLNYSVNGYGMIEDVLHLHTVMNSEGGMIDSVIKIASNGSIVV